MKPYVQLSLIILIALSVTPSFSGQRLEKNGAVYHGKKISATKFKDCYGIIIDIENGVITDEAGDCDGRGKYPPPAPAPFPPMQICITLTVEFDFGSAEIKTKYFNVVNKLADFMLKYPTTSAVIEGHCDNRESFNLSKRRAENVRKYLIEKYDIYPSRLSAKGYWNKKPIANNNTSEGRQKNRRVDVVVDCAESD